MGFPEQLKKARLNMNYTQQQVADMMLHTLCETAPIATSFGFTSHFLR